MYSLKLQNGATVGQMSMVSAVLKMRKSAVVVAVVRIVDGKKVR